ncbi:Ca(2+)-dependent cysteine protease [Microbotryomycetes sp. JL221]|nr:Ca(2+)-dependent cysteine protease [Microbotryomycetes sp. JL221]
MSYPGAGRPHGHHQTVGGGYNQAYGGAPPPPQQQQWGGPPPPQQQGGYYSGGGYNMPDPNSNYQSYGPPPTQQQQTYQQPSFGYNQQAPPPTQQSMMPAPMHYAQPGQQQPSGQGIGPTQYQQFAPHFQPPSNQQHLYSNCSGRQRYQYKREDMVLLLDLPNLGPMEQPTRANITRAMQWLVADARPNDSLFFHYSGHGGQAKDLDGDEADGYDETILPVDYNTAGQMIDDEIHHYLVRPLQQGVRLTTIFDSCHSGSALDLPYIYSTKGVIKTPNAFADAGTGALGALTSYARGDMGGLFKAVTGAGKKILNGDKAYEKTKKEKSSNADVISFSGCKDSQTSADAQINNSASGAMSHAFIASLTKYPQQSYLQLLNTIRDEIAQYSQKPQLSSSHEMDLGLLFVM